MFRRDYSFCGINLEVESFSTHPLETLAAAWREAGSPTLFNLTFKLKILEEFSQERIGGKEMISVPVHASPPHPLYDPSSRIFTIAHPHPEKHKPDHFPHFILFPLLEYALHHERIYALHASAVEMKGKAVIFAGKSGSGKSTSACELITRGARLIADDRILLFERGGEIWAAPAPAKSNPFARGLKILTGRRPRCSFASDEEETIQAGPVGALLFPSVAEDQTIPSNAAPLSASEAAIRLMKLHSDRVLDDSPFLDFFTLLASRRPTLALTLGQAPDSLYSRIYAGAFF